MIKIKDNVGLAEKETEEIMLQEMEYWQKQGKEVCCIEIQQGDSEGEYIVKSYPKQEIRRVRRITGYLSDAKNFNDAKMAEMSDRVSHEGEKK